MNKKNIFLWTLYDFANSIFVVVFFLYFSQWLVIENNIPDLFYNLMFTASSLLLVFTSPIGGAIADKVGVKKPFLNILTLFIFLSLLITSLLGVVAPPTLTVVILAMVFFTLANYFYQFSFSFYNPLLKDIAPPNKQGLISGLGAAASWFGQLVGLLITLPIAGGAIYLFGNPGRAQTFLPATIIFFLLALPMMMSFKESGKARKVVINVGHEYKTAISNFRELIKSPGIFKYLLGYFFFNDAMLTAVNNFPIYLQQVFQVPDKTKSLLLMAILVTCVIGAAFIGWISDKVGLKKILLVVIASWVVLFPSIAFVTNFQIFIALTILLGLLYGATGAITRAVMTYLSPPERINQSFSYYTMFERFSTFVGPVIWGLITSVIFHSGPFRYRVAMMSMAVFILIGLLIIRSIPSDKEVKRLA